MERAFYIALAQGVVFLVRLRRGFFNAHEVLADSRQVEAGAHVRAQNRRLVEAALPFPVFMQRYGDDVVASKVVRQGAQVIGKQGTDGRARRHPVFVFHLPDKLLHGGVGVVRGAR